MKLPEDHDRRFALANEIHARPQEPVQPPARASYLAVMIDAGRRDREHAHVAALCQRYGAHPPPGEATHFSTDLGPFRITWERHTEFSSYTFHARGGGSRPFADAAG